MRKKILYAVPVLIFMFVFIMLPFPASDLCIRVHFDAIEGSSCALYYTTDTTGSFSDTQCISQEIDHDSKQVAFILPPSLENHITGLRLDFPNAEQLICVNNITVSSAGVIKLQFNPCDFFAESNILQDNGINAINLVIPRTRAYILTSADDPYIVLAPRLCSQIADCYSHFRLTRLGVCFFILGCLFFAHKNIFTGKLP